MFWSLRKRPIVLFTLFCTFFRCKRKSNLVSNTILRYLWVDDDLTKFWLKYIGGWSILLIFLYWKSPLELVYYGQDWISFSIEKPNYLFPLNRCSDRLFEFIFWTTESREVSSAKMLGFEVKPLDKSLI